jgi:hypothetical protein
MELTVRTVRSREGRSGDVEEELQVMGKRKWHKVPEAKRELITNVHGRQGPEDRELPENKMKKNKTDITK